MPKSINQAHCIKMYKLDLNKPEDAHLITTLLLSDISRRFWEKDFVFTIQGTKEVSLAHSILFLPKEGIYKVISSNHIVLSEKSDIYDIAASFKITKDKQIIFFQYPFEIVKISKCHHSYHKKFQNMFLYEFEKSRNIKHLGVRHDIYLTNTRGYMIMRKMPGIELLQFINFMASNHVSAYYVLAVSYSMLISMREQILNYQLAHLDLKPDNLILNASIKKGLKYLQPKSISINTIDYAHSLNFENKRDIAELSVPRGSPDYVSPEIISMQYNKSFKGKPDIFAAGVMLQQLWRLYYSPKKDKILTSGEFDAIYKKYFSIQKDGITKDTFLQICLLTTNMVKANPYKRYSLDQVIRVFEYILKTSNIDPNIIYVSTTGYERNLEEIIPISSQGCLKNISGQYTFFDIERESQTGLPTIRANAIPYYFDNNNRVIQKPKELDPIKLYVSEILNLVINILLQLLNPKQHEETISKSVTNEIESEAKTDIENDDSLFQIYPESAVCFTDISTELSNAKLTEDLEKIATTESELGPQSNCLKNRSGNIWPFWSKDPIKNFDHAGCDNALKIK